ncbi:MAG: hypothetical protein OEQ13_02845 [Acidobacteriota bacterium]|nr:hypothetical protein [Acidobacteriota bacterium]
MRRARIIVISSLAVAAIAVAFAVNSESPAQAVADVRSEGGAHDVVLVQCAKRAEGFVVVAYEGSSAAPAQRSSGCAETVSLLLRDGYGLVNTGHSQDADSVNHMLVR